MYTYTQDGEQYLLSIDNHTEVVGAITAFCKERGIHCGLIEGLGAVNTATLRFLNPATKRYVDKTFDEQMECASFLGNISEKDGEVYLHIHATFGRSDYSVVGGHLLCATVNGAFELAITALPNAHALRRFDSETGLNLYEF